jgi:hypothetical protein
MGFKRMPARVDTMTFRRGRTLAARRAVIAVLLVLVVASGTAASTGSPVAAASGDDSHLSSAHVQSRDASVATAAADGHLHQRTQLSLTPDQPGEIGATTRYEVPTTVQSVRVTVPLAATVRSTSGFRKEDERTYVWDETTSSPRLVYDFSVNKTFGGGRSPGDRSAASVTTDSASAAGGDAGLVASHTQAADRGYSYVDIGSWAITPVPSMGVSWRYVSGRNVQLRKSAAVEGQGATGGEMAYLGPMTEHARTAHNQQFRLIVPASAELRKSPSAVLDSLASASGRLAIGERDPEVFFVAAPTSVEWGPIGLESGGSDAWVRADARLNSPTNAWLHEYVHMRQGYQPTEATRWTVEGAADYYAVLLTFEQGRITFDAFRERLRRGTTSPVSDAVLADPSTWEGFANYLKGALVWGVLDFRIRTSGDRSADSVLAWMNGREETVTATAFLDAVERASDDETRQFARQHTETSQTPEPWSQREHSTAFTGPNLRAALADATYRVSGPYRETTVTTNDTLVSEETLVASIPVTNVGNRGGIAEVSIRREGETVATESVDVDPGAERTVTVRTGLESAGTYTVVTDSGTVSFTVADPAPVSVRRLTVEPSSIAVGESATASVVVSNGADRPASGTVDVTSAGQQLGSERVRLDVGAETTLTFQVSFDEPGFRTLRADGTSATVEVRDPREATPTDETGSLPLSITALAVVLAALLAGRHGRSR